MKKAVAIPYIIALVLGIVVIGLVGFWFFKAGGKFGSQSLEAECQNKLFQYCVTLREDKPRTELWDNTCNNVLGITTPFPSIEKCP